jgi:hypothetical protein
MNWLWFLPVLFLFDALYVLLRKLNLPTHRLTPGRGVAAVFALSLGYCVMLGELGWIGWTKTPLIDFQNERLLPYFLVFLLGSLFHREGILESQARNKKLFVAVSATAWIPINVYLIVLLNFFLRPGEYIVSADVDGLVLWFSQQLSMLSLLYCAIATFKYYLRRQGRLGGALSRLSYNVYIIHIAVMGPIALLLLRADFPALLKYPILALTTYAASNLLAYVYFQWAKRAAANRSKSVEPAVVLAARSIRGEAP